MPAGGASPAAPSSSATRGGSAGFQRHLAARSPDGAEFEPEAEFATGTLRYIGEVLVRAASARWGYQDRAGDDHNPYNRTVVIRACGDDVTGTAHIDLPESAHIRTQLPPAGCAPLLRRAIRQPGRPDVRTQRPPAGCGGTGVAEIVVAGLPFNADIDFHVAQSMVQSYRSPSAADSSSLVPVTSTGSPYRAVAK